MAKKLYVGGLSYGTTDAVLKEGFEVVGPVESAVIIMDKATGRSKGFGFVEMSTDEDAAKAIEKYNGNELDGRRVTVNEAKPRPEGGPSRSGSTGGYNKDRGGFSNRR